MTAERKADTCMCGHPASDHAVFIDGEYVYRGECWRVDCGDDVTASCELYVLGTAERKPEQDRATENRTRSRSGCTSDIRDSRIANEHGHDNSRGHVSAPSETPSPEVGDESEWVHSEMCPTCDNSIEGRADDNESIWCPVCKKIVYPPSSLYAPRSRHVRLVRSSPLRPDYILKDGETFERDVLPIRCRAKYQQHIGTIRRVAREHGYAIGVHGSIRRDIDLIAAPWTEEASEPRVLAEAIEKAVDGVIDRCCAVSGPKPGDRGEPVVKPHGRLCWSIHLGGGPYIDLSVMPIAAAKEQR